MGKTERSFTTQEGLDKFNKFIEKFQTAINISKLQTGHKRFECVMNLFYYLIHEKAFYGPLKYNMRFRTVVWNKIIETEEAVRDFPDKYTIDDLYNIVTVKETLRFLSCIDMKIRKTIPIVF